MNRRAVSKTNPAVRCRMLSCAEEPASTGSSYWISDRSAGRRATGLSLHGFGANWLQHGLLPVRLPGAAMEHLMALAGTGNIFDADLAQRQVPADGVKTAFTIDRWRRVCLIKGLDGIAFTPRGKDAIFAWQCGDHTRRPGAWSAPG